SAAERIGAVADGSAYSEILCRMRSAGLFEGTVAEVADVFCAVDRQTSGGPQAVRTHARQAKAVGAEAQVQVRRHRAAADADCTAGLRERPGAVIADSQAGPGNGQGLAGGQVQGATERRGCNCRAVYVQKAGDAQGAAGPVKS